MEDLNGYFAVHSQGLGHASRAIALARGLTARRPDIGLLFLAGSPALDLVVSNGFDALTFPSVPDWPERDGSLDPVWRWYAEYARYLRLARRFLRKEADWRFNRFLISDGEIASVREAIRHGVALVPENRKADGLFMNFRGPENITIANLAALLYGPFLDLGREMRFSQDYFKKLAISSTGIEKSVQFLSGGNQQKVILARWLFSQARLLILDEPTQGVDIGARIEVYRIINELTAIGIAILLISSDYPELLAMSDRIAVVSNKRILQIFPSDQLSEYRLLDMASRAHHPGEGRTHET